MDNSTIIEGTVKFRDGKKWKSRWCVMRKLSPVADCLHLQLYRDSKERYKQGHTKASLSLQHFLAIETGFTLDKESNTIAIICQDVTVILAFDTRERQMQWQVKISNNLGEDVQFLIQITSAPPRAKIAAGPARLHVKEQRFCLTSGVPPRLLGFWDISQLRRYGVVEGRFVFEGGSRCGKGEGVHVCVTDQGDEITRTFQMAAQGKVATRRRPVTRNMSMMDSPRRQMLPRTSEVSSVLATPALSDLCSDDLCRLHRDGSSPYWLSTESSGGARNSDLDSNYGCGDTSSVSEHYDQSAMSGPGGWHGSSGPGGALERCVSCMSKLGALSRSSTAGTCTPLTPGPPGSGTAACWLHEAQQTQAGRDNRASAASIASSHASDGARSNPEAHCFWYDRPRLGTPPPVLPPKSPARAAAPAPSPCRPPKPTPPTQRKPPPPLPLPLALPLALGRPAACQNPACACACTRLAASYRHLAAADADAATATSPYDNYDVPKPILGHLALKDQMSNARSPGQTDVPDGYYDTPRSLREHLTTPVTDAPSPYGNYDVPASARPVQRPCGCAIKYPRTPVSASAESPAERHSCPCQRMMGWAENLMTLPYCKRGNGVENTTMPITKVRLSGEGKMPVVSPNGDIAIYNPGDSAKKFVRNDSAPSLPNQFHRDGSSCGLSDERSGIAAGVTLEVSKVNSLDRNMRPKFRDYANLAFSESLEYYENARDVLHRARMGQQATDSADQDASASLPQERVNVCDKCRHTCHNSYSKPPVQSEESETAVPPPEEGDSAESEKQDADYVSMQSVVKSLYRDAESTGRESTRSEEHLAGVVAADKHEISGVSLAKASSPLGSRQTEKSASSPNLEEAKSLLEVADILKRHAPLDELDASSQLEDCRKQQFANRKRSSSADASRFIDDVEDEPSSLDGPVSLPQAGSCDSVIHSQVMVADNVEPVSDNAAEVQQETQPRVSEPSAVVSTLHATEARIACMRRSSSVPSHRAASAVCANNRDSSSSNDSGVSIASLRHRGGDFAEFELPLTTSMSARRHHMAMRSSGSHQHHHHYHSPVSPGVGGGGRGSPCLHSSLPRRSKSVDPLRDITFQFTEVADDSQQQQQQAKSSSAEAEVPVCPKRRGFQSPGGDSAIVVPYPDSRSTSSGTSDMSDYIETLSLSSHGSSDVPDSMRFGRLAVTTLKPRSGNEYQLIDRSALEGGPNVK